MPNRLVEIDYNEAFVSCNHHCRAPLSACEAEKDIKRRQLFFVVLYHIDNTRILFILHNMLAKHLIVLISSNSVA